MTDTPGEVLSIIDGQRFGKTASLEATFVAATETAVERDGRENVYVVLGPDSSDEFRRRVEAVCPIVVDEDADGVALILSGKPDEWKTHSPGGAAGAA